MRHPVCDSWQCLSMENQFNWNSRKCLFKKFYAQCLNISKLWYIYFVRDIMIYCLVLIDNTHILNTKSFFQELETHSCLLHKKLLLFLYVNISVFLFVLVFSVRNGNPTQSEIVLLCFPPQNWNLTLSEIAPLLSTSISRNSDFTSFNEIFSQFSSSTTRI